MKTTSIKYLLAAVAAVIASHCAHADFILTMDSPPLSSEWTGNVIWGQPAAWSGGGAAWCQQNAEGWTQGTANGGNPQFNPSYGSGEQQQIWAIVNAGTTFTNNGHLAFDVIVDGTSFPNLATETNSWWWQIWVAGNSVNTWHQLNPLSNPYHSAGDTAQHVYHVDLTFVALGWTNPPTTSYFQLPIWANGPSHNDTSNPGTENPAANIVNFYIDNMQVYTYTTTAPTNSISKVTGPTGLTLVTTTNSTVDNEEYERQGVVATNDYSWTTDYTSQGNTYALTITNFPSATYSNYEAYMFLVGEPVAVEPNPDWNEANVIVLAVQNNADGSARATLSYKVNEPGGNSQYYSSGALGTVTNASGAKGTWTLSVAQNYAIDPANLNTSDQIIVKTPDGNTLSTNLAAGTSSLYFDGQAGLGATMVYLGSQPNATNNIGQSVVYSGCKITYNAGGSPLLSDNFSSAQLQYPPWQLAAEDPTGVIQVPANAAFWWQWTTPDANYVQQTSASLGATAAWSNPGLLPHTVFGTKETVFIPTTMVVGHPTGFFQLTNSAY
jgi:hypothetical protein